MDGNGYTFEELSRVVGRIAAEYGMRRVCLFGSRVRGDNGPDSDYDFCVVTGEDCTLFTLSGFMIDLRDALHAEVDVVCEDALREDFAKTIIDDRRVLYEA